MAGRREWFWHANFGADTALPARLGSSLIGRHRFCVDGQQQGGTGPTPYTFRSDPFELRPWPGLTIENVVVADRSP